MIKESSAGQTTLFTIDYSILTIHYSPLTIDHSLLTTHYSPFTMKIHPLNEGSYSVDASKKFIPFNPEVDSYKDRPASFFIQIKPFLVETADDLILLHSGLGYKDTRDELHIHQSIRNLGFDPGEVSLVLMSHLHYDHSGGLVVERGGSLVPSFPNARHIIQK